MYYTSGTTGKPKGVRRPPPDGDPENGPVPFAELLEWFGIGESADDVHLCGSPLYHTAVLAFAASSLHLGHTVVLIDRWTPEGMLERIERYRVTQTHMVPTQFRRLLLLPAEQRARYDCSSLRCVIHGAAPCEVSIKQAMLDWWGPVIFEYYGTTEGGGTIVKPEEWLAHPGTVGRSWPGADLRILDEDGRQLPPGAAGTVFIRAAQADFEYYNDEAKTQENRRGDYFTVGDLGSMDADGFLYLLGRSSELIISAGVNIYPAEIEAALIGQPAVADVAVIGVPDLDRGEAVKALIEVADGFVAGPELSAELLATCASRLAPFKLPRTIEFVTGLPRDPSGKLRKRLLQAAYANSAAGSSGPLAAGR
jgi:long-chain acyl-CoA synthetase